MALHEHIASLRKRHNEYDLKIQAESSRPFPDDVLLHQLKAEKLKIKDTIVELEGTLVEAA
ncbi:MAG: YdcH family protein [Bdellovibrionales bacterium]